MEKHRIPRVYGYILVLVVVIVVTVLAVMNVIPQLVEQTIQLTRSLPTYAEETSKWLNEVAQREEFKNFNLEEQLASANLSLSNLFNIALVSLTSSVSKIISLCSSFLFCYLQCHSFSFMFKDGHKFIDALSKFFPQNIRGELRQTVEN